MAAHDPTRLWAYAKGELDAQERAELEAHLKGCNECFLALEDVKAAIAVAFQRPVPPLKPEQWRLVDANVMEAARKQLARKPGAIASLVEWVRWNPARGWAGAALVAAAIAVFVFWPKQVPRQEQPIAEAPKPAPASPIPPQPGPAPVAAPAQIRVAKAVRAHVGKAPLSPSSIVTEGQTVSTDKGGEASLALADGSHATVLGNAALKLTRAEARSVDLDLARGKVLVAAAHHEPHTFHVQAGDVEVEVVGTKFLVERDEAGVIVAVDEGTVEARSNGRTERISAGHAVAFRGDQVHPRAPSASERVLLARLEPAQELRSPRAESRGEPVEPAPVPVDEATPPIPDQAEQTPAPEQSPSPVADAAGWAEWTPGDAGGFTQTVPAPPLVTLKEPPGAPARDAGHAKKTLFDEVWPPSKWPAHLNSPLIPVDLTPEEAKVREMVRLADQGACRVAIQMADEYLATVRGGGDALLRHNALFTKARCLDKLGFHEDARRVREQMR